MHPVLNNEDAGRPIRAPRAYLAPGALGLMPPRPMPPRPVRRSAAPDVLQVLLSAGSVYLLRHVYSVGAVAYTSVVLLQIAFDDQRPGLPRAPSVHAATHLLVEVLVKVACSLFACGVLVLFNHEAPVW